MEKIIVEIKEETKKRNLMTELILDLIVAILITSMSYVIYYYAFGLNQDTDTETGTIQIFVGTLYEEAYGNQSEGDTD